MEGATKQPSGIYLPAAYLPLLLDASVIVEALLLRLSRSVVYLPLTKEKLAPAAIFLSCRKQYRRSKQKKRTPNNNDAVANK